jgi:ABC-2 type transport system ATP-binding protein
MTQLVKLDADTEAPSPDRENSAVFIDQVVKRYSSRLKTLTSPGVHSVSQPRNFVSVLLGRTPRNFVALDHISLTIAKSEVFGILGPNGAGKTTLIKVLSTLVIPDEGKAYVHGIDVVRRPREALRRLQTVLAGEVGFERRLTGRQNLEFYADLYGIPKDAAKAKISNLLEMVGLADRSGMMFNRYSTGMARKLLLCRALLSDASVLVFDEPTAGLDPIAAAEFRLMMKSFISREKHKTVLIASHNLWEVQQICDRVAVMKQGRVVATGSPSQISEEMEDRVSVTLAGRLPDGYSSEGLAAELSGVSGVTRCLVQPGQTAAQDISISVEGSKELDYTSIFAILLKKGFVIMSLETSQPSLEEAFIKLAGEGTNWSHQWT